MVTPHLHQAPVRGGLSNAAPRFRADGAEVSAPEKAVHFVESRFRLLGRCRRPVAEQDPETSTLSRAARGTRLGGANRRLREYS